MDPKGSTSPEGRPGGASGSRIGTVLRAVLWIAVLAVSVLFFPALLAIVLLWRRRHLFMPRRRRSVYLLPPGDPLRGLMSNFGSTTPQALRVQGVISAVNRGGVKIDGRWYNYPRGYASERIPREAVGAFAVLLVAMFQGKPYIDSVLKLERVPAEDAPASPPAPGEAPVESPAPEAAAPQAEAVPVPEVATATEPEAAPVPPEAAPAGDKRWAAEPSTDAQRQKIARLADQAGMPITTVETVARLAFRDSEKSMATLTKGEASRLIVLLDGEPPALPRRRRGR